MMHSQGQSVTVRHKEFVTTIKGSADFKVQRALILNPGLSGTFPWLSNLAKSYQEYNVKGMVFHYIPTSGTAISGTNSALGSVMMQTSYRSNDDPPTSKVQILNEFWSNEVVPCETMAHPIECDPRENPFNIHYVRGTSVPTGDNQLLYDLGVTYVATQGMQAENEVGDLWVTYEVEFKKPIVTSNVTTGNSCGFYIAGGSSANLFSGAVQSQVGSMKPTFAVNTITMPPGSTGSFTLVVHIVSTGQFSGTITWLGGCTLVNAESAGLDGYSSTYATSTTGVTGVNALTYAFGFKVGEPGLPVTLTVPTPTIPVGVISSVRFCIFRMD
jgi:hypothetical protein